MERATGGRSLTATIFTAHGAYPLRVSVDADPVTVHVNGASVHYAATDSVTVAAHDGAIPKRGLRRFTSPNS